MLASLFRVWQSYNHLAWFLKSIVKETNITVKKLPTFKIWWIESFEKHFIWIVLYKSSRKKKLKILLEVVKKMGKSLKQKILEIAKSYLRKVYELFKDAHNFIKVFFIVSQPWFPFTQLKNTLKNRILIYQLTLSIPSSQLKIASCTNGFHRGNTRYRGDECERGAYINILIN